MNISSRSTLSLCVAAASFGIAALSACSSNAPPQGAPQPSPAVLGTTEAPLRPLPTLDAQLRMVGSETTWVAHGPGYELIARSRPDMPALKAVLDQQSRNFRAAFGAEPHNVIITLRRVSPDPRFTLAAAPYPPTHDPVIEVAVGDTGFIPVQPTAHGPMRDTPTGYRTMNVFPERRIASLGPVARVLATWIGARGDSIASAGGVESASSDSARAPGWAVEALGALGTDSMRVTLWAAELDAASDSLIPVDRLVTMAIPHERPAIAGEGRGAQDAREGRRGMQGGEGRRGGRGYGQGPEGQGFGFGILRGPMLFTLESRVFGHYLASREGPQLIGRVVDAQLQGKPFVAALAGLQTVPDNVSALETQWRHWLDYRAKYTRGR